MLSDCILFKSASCCGVSLVTVVPVLTGGTAFEIKTFGRLLSAFSADAIPGGWFSLCSLHSPLKTGSVSSAELLGAIMGRLAAALSDFFGIGSRCLYLGMPSVSLAQCSLVTCKLLCGADLADMGLYLFVGWLPQLQLAAGGGTTMTTLLGMRDARTR